MNKPQTFKIPTSQRNEQPLRSSEVMRLRHEVGTGPAMMGWTKRYRQLEWEDRLNLVLAAILGLGLVMALSPILLISWICLRLAERGIRFGRPASLKTERPQI